MRVEVTAADAKSVQHIAEHLRAEDKMEIETSSGMSATQALCRGWQWSTHSWLMLVGGEPAVVFGVVADPHRAGSGAIWMLCTDRISKAPLGVYRASADALQQILVKYPHVYNQADCRNALHLRWIQRLGFTLDNIVQVNGYPFQRFHFDRKESPNV